MAATGADRSVVLKKGSVKLAGEDSPEPGGGKRSPIPWAEEIARYQESLRREKLALLAVPAVRGILVERLLSMHEPSRQRRINAAEVVGLISRLRSQHAPALEAVLAALDRLKLNIFWWNTLREAAEEDRSGAAEEWRRCRSNLAAVAEPLLVAGLRIVERFVSEEQKPEIREAIRSDGIIGIYRALERFDPGRNKSFPQYATYWVRNEIATGALRSRVVPLTGHGRRKQRKEAVSTSDPEAASPSPELHLLSLDAPGAAIDSEEEGGSLHEVLPDRKTSPPLLDAQELIREWLEILQDCPDSLRPFLVLRYYFPVWPAEAAGAVRGAEVFEALAPMARERLTAATSPIRISGFRHPACARRDRHLSGTNVARPAGYRE